MQNCNTNRQFAFARDLDGVRVVVTVNNDDNDAWMNLLPEMHLNMSAL